MILHFFFFNEVADTRPFWADTALISCQMRTHEENFAFYLMSINCQLETFDSAIIIIIFTDKYRSFS